MAEERSSLCLMDMMAELEAVLLQGGVHGIFYGGGLISKVVSSPAGEIGSILEQI